MNIRPSVKTHLRIPNNLHFLPVAINFVQGNAHIRGFNEDAISDIELATEEAVSNVIQHAFEPGVQTVFDLFCIHIPLGLKIVVKDKGIPFHPSEVPDFAGVSPERDPDTKGLGWFLMKRFMDELSFHNLGKDGKELHLIKYLPEEKLTSAKEGIPEVLDQKPPPPAPKSIPFKVRRAQKKDALDIAKCAYDVYGYTYVYEHIYYPERFGGLIEGGEVISVVAETKSQSPQIMAHNALIIEDPENRVAEMALTFTKYDFQNQGAGKKLGFLLVKEAIKKGIIGITGTAVTTHLYSQIGTLRAGAKECGLLLGLYSQAKLKYPSVKDQRFTCTLSYFNVPVTSTFSFSGPQKLYVPEQHKKMVEQIYKNLKRKVRFLTVPNSPVGPTQQLPTVKIKVKKDLEIANIVVLTFGENTLDYIRSQVKVLCREKIEVLFLYLPMNTAHTAQMCADLENFGFFFSGILPQPVTGDKLILQYFNDIELDYDQIHLYSDFAKELRSYIQERDPSLRSAKQSI